MTKMAVSVSVKGLKALGKKLNTAEEMHAFRTELLEPAAKIGLMATSANAPKFSGQMIGSMTTEIEAFSAKVKVPKPYAMVMETGRKPGGKMPPAAMLEQWARKYGITNTFVLARAIAKRGIKGRFFRRKGRVAIRKELPSMIVAVERKMEHQWGENLGSD